MFRLIVAFLAAGAALTQPLGAQRAGAAARGNVTFAVFVSDPSGAPMSGVKVTMTGRAERTWRTEGGRLVFEELPPGSYRFRFEKEGFVTVEREVTGRGSAPIDVKVTLSPRPAPPAPIPPVETLRAPATDAKIIVLDMPAFIEKHYVGRAGGKTMPLGCSAGGSSTLIQINEPIATHQHDAADEILYVIAGQGSANLGDRHEPLAAGVFVTIPRGVAHGFTTGPKKPLVMISIRAGDACAG